MGGIEDAAAAAVSTGDCNSFITDRILLPATLSIVSNSCADFSALVIFFCCTAYTAVTGGGSLDVSGRIWNGGVDGGVVVSEGR